MIQPSQKHIIWFISKTLKFHWKTFLIITGIKMPLLHVLILFPHEEKSINVV